MATPMEQIVMVEKALKMLTTVVQDNAPRHGLGNAQSEADRCEQVHVFLRCIGKSSSLAENQRLLLPKHLTVVDARLAMEAERGAPMRQESVRDENGFRFSKSMLNEPLWKFSNGCKLNLSFQDDWSKEVGKDFKGAWETTKSAVGLGG